MPSHKHFDTPKEPLKNMLSAAKSAKCLCTLPPCAIITTQRNENHANHKNNNSFFLR